MLSAVVCVFGYILRLFICILYKYLAFLLETLDMLTKTERLSETVRDWPKKSAQTKNKTRTQTQIRYDSLWSGRGTPSAAATVSVALAVSMWSTCINNYCISRKTGAVTQRAPHTKRDT